MSTINMQLINRPSYTPGEDLSADDITEQHAAAFEEQLGYDSDMLSENTDKLDAETLEELNQKFLHESIALGGLYDAFKSANKQDSGANGTDQSMPGLKEHFNHINRELSLDSQEFMMNTPELPVG